MSEKKDPRADHLKALHSAYRSRKLRLLIGAGVSIPAGFPSWDELIVSLLDQYIDDQIRKDQIPDIPERDRTELARKLSHVLGRDGAAELVRQMEDEQFGQFLATALYGSLLKDGRTTIAQLNLTTVQRQLACMERVTSYYTTNFDTTLELALATVRETAAMWEQYRQPEAIGFERRKDATTSVTHIHGWLDPDGRHSQPIVLTEAHYVQLTIQPESYPNKKLTEAVSAESGSSFALLVVGMSLSDPNLRRMIYLLSGDMMGRTMADIYVILKEEDPLLDRYVAQRWKRLKVKVIFIKSHDEIASVLRDIQFGIPASETDPPSWAQRAIRSVESKMPAEIVYSTSWQACAHQALKALECHLRLLFAVPGHEQIQIALFAPHRIGADLEPHCCAVASSREQLQTVNWKERYCLSLRGQTKKSIPCAAYAGGTALEFLFDDLLERDRDRIRELQSIWPAKNRDWRSLIAYPIVEAAPDANGPKLDPVEDAYAWLPQAVIVLTSNRPRPFWTRFGKRQIAFDKELREKLEAAALSIVDLASRPAPC